MKQPQKNDIDYDQAPELTASDIKLLKPLSELLDQLSSNKNTIKVAKYKKHPPRHLQAA